MKTLAGIVLFVLLGVAVNGQTAVGSKIIAETSAMSEKIVKGSPFTAEAVNESVQVLADGNRIVRSSTNKLYRNSEGRFRREISGNSGGSLSTFYTVGPGITILDPVLGFRYLIDYNLKTARVATLKEAPLALSGTLKVLPAQAAIEAATADKIRTELAAERVRSEVKATVAAAPTAAVAALKEKAFVDATRAYGEGIATYSSGSLTFGTPSRSKYETRTEELGVQNIEGVDAVGTRVTTTIPAGDIGNERPIEIVYEKWFSNELQLVVMSKQSDPRFGEQTYRLTNIVRSEPDPSLFEVPTGYKVLSETTPAYKISGTAPQGQNVVYTAKPATVVTVKPARP